MGRVFSNDQIEAGLVPTPESFKSAKAMFDLEVAIACARGDLHAGILFGSVAVGQQTIRSDFDCLLVTSNNPDAAKRAKSIVRSVVRASGNSIEVGAITHRRDVLASGRHDIDRFFGEHLTGEQRHVVGEDIAGYIAYDKRSPFDIFSSYIRNKKRKLSESYNSDDPDKNLRGVQRMLELPLAVGRKFLKAIDEIDGTNIATNETAIKEIVRVQSLALFDRFGHGEEARRLVAADAEYSHILSQAIFGAVDRADYNEHIRELTNQMPYAERWLDTVDESITNYVSTR